MVNRLISDCYWTAIAAINSVGHIPSHHIRNSLYRNVFKVKLSKSATIYKGARWWHPWNVKIGDYSFIGDNAFFDGRRGIEIGDNVSIATEAMIFTLEHDWEKPTFEVKGGKVTIGNMAYIGSRVTILPEVHIGEGAVVASGAVVTDNVEPWVLVGGVPARYIKRRRKMSYELKMNRRATFQ